MIVSPILNCQVVTQDNATLPEEAVSRVTFKQTPGHATS
jgi:hypothetical protein